MCSRRRSAHIDNAITPILDAGEWEFVTLNASTNDIPWGNGVGPRTKPPMNDGSRDVKDIGPDAIALRLRMGQMWDTLNKVRDGIRHELGVSAIDAIVTMECTKRPFSPPNPHIHMIVPKGMGAIIVRHWVKQADRFGLIALAWDGIKDGKESPNLWKPVSDKHESKREILKYVMAPVVKQKKTKAGKEYEPCLVDAPNYRMIDLGGTDAIVSAFKGSRRFRLWGRFYGVDKRVKSAETADVDELDGGMVEYFDIPEGCYDVGPDMVKTNSWLDDRGRMMSKQKVQPSFTRDVRWVYCAKVQDWLFKCDHTGAAYALTHAPPRPFPELWAYDKGKRWRNSNPHSF